MAELRGHFRPEFLNRVDDTVLFTPLDPRRDRAHRRADAAATCAVRLADRDITLEIDEEARRFIAREGYDPVYGARPLRRFIAREVETRIARALLRDAVPDGAGGPRRRARGPARRHPRGARRGAQA